MKNVLLIAVIATLSLGACGQSNEKVPEKVQKAFTQKFPNAQKVKWTEENEEEWEAEFRMKGMEYSANYDEEGNWKETEHEIRKSEIPGVVNRTLESEFGSYKVKESEISETAKGKVFEFQLKKSGTKKEVAIDANGKVVNKDQSSEKEDEEDEEDED